MCSCVHVMTAALNKDSSYVPVIVFDSFYVCTLYGLRSTHCISFNCNCCCCRHYIQDAKVPIIDTLFGNKVDYFA